MKHQYTLSDFQKRLRYEPETGRFFWISATTNKRIKAGSEAGKNHDGYRRLTVFGRNWAAHRVAWLFATGEWPKKEIDHINGNPSDNRICNLRDVDHSTNQLNLKACKKSNLSTGILGVSFCDGRYRARVQINGRCKWLGSFKTLEDAKEARIKAHPQINRPGNLDANGKPVFEPCWKLP